VAESCGDGFLILALTGGNYPEYFTPRRNERNVLIVNVFLHLLSHGYEAVIQSNIRLKRLFTLRRCVVA